MPGSGTEENVITGISQVAAAGDASSSVCSVIARKAAGLSPRGKQRLLARPAEILRGERERAVDPDLAQREVVLLLAVPQDDHGLRHGQRRKTQAAVRTRKRNRAPHDAIMAVVLGSSHGVEPDSEMRQPKSTTPAIRSSQAKASCIPSALQASAVTGVSSSGECTSTSAPSSSRTSSTMPSA